MQAEVAKKATKSAAAGGQAPRAGAAIRPFPGFTPVYALLVGGLLVVVCLLALRWTWDADPARDCDGLGVPALTLAGTPERSAQILVCDAFHRRRRAPPRPSATSR